MKIKSNRQVLIERVSRRSLNLIYYLEMISNLGNVAGLFDSQIRITESNLSDIISSAEDLLEEGPESVANILNDSINSLLSTRQTLIAGRGSLRHTLKSGATVQAQEINKEAVKEMPQYKTWIRILEVILFCNV